MRSEEDRDARAPTTSALRDSSAGRFGIDPRLRTHKIHRLSAHYGRIIYAVEIEADLRAVFYIDGDRVITVDIGTHDVYKR